MGWRDRKLARTCVKCERSCAMYVQTDVYIYIYIYKYRWISNGLQLLASLCSPFGNSAYDGNCVYSTLKHYISSILLCRFPNLPALIHMLAHTPAPALVSQLSWLKQTTLLWWCLQYIVSTWHIVGKKECFRCLYHQNCYPAWQQSC